MRPLIVGIDLNHALYIIVAVTVICVDVVVLPGHVYCKVNRRNAFMEQEER
jgi:hypothetical protein